MPSCCCEYAPLTEGLRLTLIQAFIHVRGDESKRWRIHKLTIHKETRAKTDDKDIHYYDRSRIAKCVTMVITMMVLLLLVLPVGILYRLALSGEITTSPETICVLVVFTLVFTATLSAFTKAKRHEIVAASAA